MTAFGKTLMGAFLCATVSLASPVKAADISGAGATFPAPLYAKWADDYKKISNVALNYQAIGSGGGIKQIKAKTVDFGATDKPLDPKELGTSGLVQWPMVMGGIVPVVNLKGIEAGQLKLTGQLIADIYLGKITKWNDKAIAEINKDIKLPDLAIAPVYRSDGSGTTYNFTYYLAAVTPDWKEKVGVDTSVQFPSGIGGKGNDGVANITSQTEGAIGYVEFAFAKQNKLTYTQLSNKEGIFLQPTAKTFEAAAANADWAHAPGYQLVLANQPGKESWPMTAATFILMNTTQEKPEAAHEALKFFDYSFKNGQKAALELDYVPMPASVVDLIEKTWKETIKDTAGKAIWTK